MTTTWNAEAYDANHAYIWNLARGVVDLLDPQPGEHILDLGCGTGHLTAAIAAKSATVLGMDSDAAMVEQSKQNYPAIEFVQRDGADFDLSERFDAVFSSAVLHWIPQAAWVASNVYRSLKPGGRFVAEFGTRGNVQAILSAIVKAMNGAGWHRTDDWTPWYFPTMGQYLSLLEDARFTVEFAQRFERPTPLDGGEDGLRNWLEIFAHRLFPEVGERDRPAVEREVERLLRPVLCRDGLWTADYVRLRFVARKAMRE
ncbi:MAG: class I SAM-dependent methyltransferase [Dehalococcoidia bacterium]|nr:class I SAM-dependent methyltransferase [Dehalococcoidia bacterium]